jgi:hypothetical protein
MGNRRNKPGAAALLVPVFQIVLAGALWALPAQASEPEVKFRRFTPGELWPDDQGVPINAHGGGILLHEGVYYWFGEHKVAGEAGNKAEVGVHVYSSRDLYNWKDGGIALAVSEDPGSEIAKGCILERPKVLYNAKTRTFVMWFHLELKGRGYDAARAGLAVSDTATGPYTYVKSLRPNAGIWPENITEELKHPREAAAPLKGSENVLAGNTLRRDMPGGQMSRDMTLFRDDDGKGYLLSSAEDNFTLALHELSEDYQDFTGRWTRLFPGGLNEAPALFKKNGTYYLITSGCTGWSPNAARSFAADSLWGPWTELGNPCRGAQKENGSTFESQSTYVLPAPGRPGEFIYMGDRWRPENAIDGRYVWLPVEWEKEKPILRWHDAWDLSRFY